MGGVGVVMYLGEHSGPGSGFISDLWSAAKTASPLAAMFAILVWTDERRERREAQKQCNERTLDFIRSVGAQTVASDKIGANIGHLSDIIQEIRPNHRRGRRG